MRVVGLFVVVGFAEGYTEESMTKRIELGEQSVQEKIEKEKKEPHPLTAKRSTKFHKQVFERDNGICCICGLDITNYEKLLARWQKKYCFDDIRKILKEHGLPAPKIGYLSWQIDHEKPLARGGQTMLTNLRLLCLTCHKDVTKDLKKQLAALPDKIRDLEINRGAQ